METLPESKLTILQGFCKNNLLEVLGIEFTELGEDYICAKMPVQESTRQPMGFLHGGAAIALAETLGSVGSYLSIDGETHSALGLSVNANHVRSVREGYVYAKATALHKGKTTHIWDIRILDEKDRLVCVSRLTVAIVPKF